LREALARASESERRFRDLADSAPVLIWTSDESGLVDFINRGWLEFTGRGVREELGDSWTVGVHPDDAQGLTESWWKAFHLRVPWEREYRLRRHDGSYRWIFDRGVPRFVGDRFVGYVGSATDIDERKQAEEGLALAYRRDHEVAETLQRSLLPERLPAIDGVALEARYLPATSGAAIGGDWYDALELDETRVAVVVGDVVGHGLRAAAAMGQIRNAFRAYALLGSSPAATLGRLNRLLAVDGHPFMATAFHAIVDRESGAVEYCSAGHPPAVVVEAGGARLLEESHSVPLGTAEPVDYRDASASLAPGATLLLYTDGLVERRSEPLDDRLSRLGDVAGGVDGELGEVCDTLLDRMVGGEGASDDVALLALQIEPVADRLVLRLAADPAVLRGVRRRLGRMLDAAGASSQERYEVTLTVCEAAANAIEHAYGPADADFEVEVRLEDGEVLARVSDSGRWREQRPAADGTRGRGLGIIEGLMDEVEVTRSELGTTVRMRRALERGAAA
jgi:PAS domain S-box-containing protein